MANIKERVKDETTGKEVIIYDDGTRKDAATGYFLAGPPAHRITSERGKAMVAIAKENSFRDRARAFARRNGIDPDTATDAEILEGYSRGRENIHGHAYDLYMQSKTARGAEGLYNQLVRISDDPAAGSISLFTANDDKLIAATALLKAMQDAIKQPQPVEVIDGTSKTITGE